MVASADHVEWVVVGTEVEALMLEHSLIQTHQPRFNVRLKDDKSYPWLAITVGEEWPRPIVFRGRKRKGVRYFGPYGHVGALRETLDLLLRSFPLRTCSEAKFKRHARLGRPCLLYDIERCSGPCVGAVDHDRYGRMVDDLMRFLCGDTRPVVTRLETEMADAADALEFERAARLRDRLTAVRKAAETQQMVSERPEDFDVVGTAEDELEAAVQVFHVRRGRVVGRVGFVADKVEDLTAGQLLDRVVEQLYGPAGADVPRRILLPVEPESADGAGDVAGRCPARTGRPGGAAAGDEAGPPGDGHPQRRRGPRPPPDASGRRPQQPVEGADGAAGRPRPADRAAADRVLRHEPPPGDGLRRLDGRLRGRPGEEVGLPPVQGQDGRRQRRLRGDGGGADAPADRARSRSEPSGTRNETARRGHRTRQTSWRPTRRSGPVGAAAASGGSRTPPSFS